MKIRLLLFISALSLIYINSVAQKKLSTSKTSGNYTYIYKLTDSEMKAISLKNVGTVNDSYLHTRVDSFAIGSKYKKHLPFGNYLYATPIKDKWHYQLNDKKNVELAFVNDKKHFQFFVKDLRGNLIDNAVVEIGRGKKAKYDKTTRLYKSSYRQQNQIIKVRHESVSNFFSFEEQKRYNYRSRLSFHKKILYSFPIRYTWLPFKNLYKKITVPSQKSYTGYMVFSKPKYKPLDTVKFKAYIVERTGKEIKPLDAEVILFDRGDKQKKLGTITPYRNGAYEYSFVLADSLNLTLDRRYNIRLQHLNKKKENDFLIAGNFNYEEYELKSIDFKMRSSKPVLSKADSVTIYLKATDENELAVPDGRVSLLATTSNIKTYHRDTVFVPDTLWKKEMKLEPVGETKVVIPSSVFPNADMDFRLKADFLNSNNEAKSASLNLKIEEKENEPIIVKLEKDTLVFSRSKSKEALNEPVLLKSYSFNDELLDSVVLNLSKIKADYRAEYYDISYQGKDQTYYLTDNKPNLSISALHTKDSVRIKVNNENKIPFWYTVFSANKVMFKGYTTQLDTLLKHNSDKAVHVSLSYFWDGDEKTVQGSTFYDPNELNVKLITPEVVYPGQKVNMLVKVTDIDNKPVTDVDVTVYAQTSKFGAIRQPSFPRFSRNYRNRKLSSSVKADEISASGNFKLSWQKWAKSLGLDTIEYYKFTNHKGLYATTESTKNNITQISPFVINDGEIDPVNIVYVDDIPVYFNQVDQLTAYAFEVKPGKRDIILRTTTRNVVLRDFDVKAGKRTILSVSSDLDNQLAKVTAEKSELSSDEASHLDRYMIRIAKFRNGYEKEIIKYDSTTVLVNPPKNNAGASFLLGPFNENLLTYQSEGVSHNFIREQGYVYTFLPNLVKQKSFSSPYAFNKYLSPTPMLGNDNYLQQIIKKTEVDSIWNDYLDLRSYTTTIFNNETSGRELRGKLKFQFADSLIKKPYLKNIIIYQPDCPNFMHIYPGNQQNRLFNLEEGTYKIIFLLKDNSYYLVENIVVKRNGLHYYKWNNLKAIKADKISLELDTYIKSFKNQGNKIGTQVMELVNDKEVESFSSFNNLVTGRILSKKDKQPLAGAMVKIVGVKHSVFTNANGYFKIDAPKRGKISIASIGFNNLERDIKQGNLGDIYLEESTALLQEVVVVGYGTVQKKSLMGSVARIETTLAGKLKGVISSPVGEGPNIMIRGSSSITGDNKPLYIIDGIPYDKEPSSINPNEIDNIEVLKDASATALYGARAANGVIIIKTKKGNSLVSESGELVAQQQTMRTNFSDEGFWQPKLNTDKDGNAIFSVKFPDDITSWNTSVIAMNGKKQIGFTTAKIRSFKSLSANMVGPQFAILGDSINIIGKLMNYLPKEEKMQRKMLYNNDLYLNSNVVVKNSLIDTIPIKVVKQDSIKLEYTLTQESGYFDGEVRKIPVFAKGVKETKGYFAALNSDTTTTYSFDKNLGKVSVRAESSLFPILLDEMKHLYRYEYLCNEQMASKLKSLLLEKQLKNYLKQNFEYEKDIKQLIRKLNTTKKNQGTWGWWQDGDEEIWISLHVVEALLLAEKSGYQVELNKDKLYDYLRRQLVYKQDYSQLKTVELLYLLNDKNHINDWLSAIEKGSGNYRPTSYEKLKLSYLKQISGTKVNIDSLLEVKKQTMFGNIYWGENKMHFWNNDVQNTLLVYKILKANGSNQQEQNKIINYFLEQRKDGKWQNTYESSLILEAILPHLLKNNANKETPQIELNGTVINKFPYQQEFESNEKLQVKKKGNLPVYFTAYQQFQNTDPKKMDKGFVVNTVLLQNEKEVTSLKAGQAANIKVEVEVKADADYVMIEVPIPAGCSYDSKVSSYWGVETHREYFKEKTSIFCTKLKQGKYTFNISLMPRYNGEYVLNPAKAEMMYFPVFYGRDGMKSVAIN